MSDETTLSSGVIAELPSDAQRRIAALPPELRDIAARLYPSHEREGRAREQRTAQNVSNRERRMAWLKTISTRALSGDFGTAVRLAAHEALRPGHTEQAFEDVLAIVITERERRSSMLR